jgi:hypothetical protein
MRLMCFTVGVHYPCKNFEGAFDIFLRLPVMFMVYFSWCLEVSISNVICIYIGDDFALVLIH